MEKFVISGKKKLSGEIKVSGAKNSALKLIAATLLTKEECVIENVPDIADIAVLIDLLRDLGADIKKLNEHTYSICCKNIRKTELNPKLVQRLRASVVLLAPMLARFGEVKFPHPGGCVIGKRPIDIYLDGFKALGVEIEEKNNCFSLKAKKLKGSKFVLPLISVTVTESMILAGVFASGVTIIKNAACEPEIEAMCDYLNSRGARIRGGGTHSIEITGVNNLSGGRFCTIPDRIETGTFAILGALICDGLKITKCNPEHLEVFWKLLEEAGGKFDIHSDFVYIKPSKELKACKHVVTHEYPGFATDLQAPFTVLLTQAKGISLVHETIYEGRLFYTDILSRMGANITMCDPHRVIINGPTELHGRKMESPDLRAGIALVIAALIASEKSEIENVYQIDRGYENIEGHLRQIGADIKRVKE